MAFAEGEGLDTRYVPASSLLLRSTDNTTKTLFKSTLRVYKMFLVVKSIELLSSRDLPPPSPHDNYVDWGTPCNAPHIVDLMWHSHILHTRRYAEETKGIAGQVVHHNPGYWCPKEKREQANFLRKGESALVLVASERKAARAKLKTITTPPSAARLSTPPPSTS
jgi:hypothetical protein